MSLMVCFVSALTARSEQPIKIRLRDVNDEVPRFVNLPMPFLATISSSAAPGTSVYQLVAQDDDEDSLIRYVMESGKMTKTVS